MNNNVNNQALAPALNAAVMTAVEEIKTIRNMTIQFAQMAEAQIMERLWGIRKEFADDASFGVFVAEQTNIDAKTAVRYVVTWDGARQNRGLRELANQSPDQAMSFVQRLTAGGIKDRVVADDKEVARLLSMPARKQHRELRKLIDAARGDSTATSTASAPATPSAQAPASVTPIKESFAARAKAHAEKIYKAQRLIAEACTELAESDVQRIQQTQRHLMIEAIDMSIDRLEALSGRLLDQLTPDQLAGRFDD